MVRVLEPDLICYFAHGLVGAHEKILHASDYGKVNIFYRRLASLLFHQVAEIIRGEMQLFGTPRHRRQSEVLRLAGIEIAVQESLETHKYILVDRLPGGKHSQCWTAT